MSKYLHKKGQIKVNALAALMSDPLFKQRIEKNVKGKGSYCRKSKHNKQDYQGAGKNRLISLFFPASWLFCSSFVPFIDFVKFKRVVCFLD